MKRLVFVAALISATGLASCGGDNSSAGKNAPALSGSWLMTEGMGYPAEESFDLNANGTNDVRMRIDLLWRIEQEQENTGDVSGTSKGVKSTLSDEGAGTPIGTYYRYSMLELLNSEVTENEARQMEGLYQAGEKRYSTSGSSIILYEGDSSVTCGYELTADELVLHFSEEISFTFVRVNDSEIVQYLKI